MLASLARTLHVGVLADCFSDPGTAACLKQATNIDGKMPLTALCQPTRCPMPASPHAIGQPGHALPRTPRPY